MNRDIKVVFLLIISLCTMLLTIYLAVAIRSWLTGESFVRP